MTNVPATQEELSALVQELICGDDERAEQAALKIGPLRLRGAGVFGTGCG